VRGSESKLILWTPFLLSALLSFPLSSFDWITPCCSVTLDASKGLLVHGSFAGFDSPLTASFFLLNLRLFRLSLFFLQIALAYFGSFSPVFRCFSDSYTFLSSLLQFFCELLLSQVRKPISFPGMFFPFFPPRTSSFQSSSVTFPIGYLGEAPAQFAPTDSSRTFLFEESSDLEFFLVLVPLFLR